MPEERIYYVHEYWGDKKTRFTAAKSRKQAERHFSKNTAYHLDALKVLIIPGFKITLERIAETGK